MDEDKVNKILDIEEAEVVDDGPVNPPLAVKTDVKDDTADNDVRFARENIIDMIQSGSYALDDLMGVAKTSQQARAYEVVSTLMKTLVDANKDLVNLHKKKIEINSALNGGKETANTTDANGDTINNNLFVGSTNELYQLMKEMNKKE